MVIWTKTTRDKYELPIAVADSAQLLARMLGVKPTVIFSNIINCEKLGKRCCYHKIVIEDEGEEDD